MIKNELVIIVLEIVDQSSCRVNQTNLIVPHRVCVVTSFVHLYRLYRQVSIYVIHDVCYRKVSVTLNLSH